MVNLCSVDEAILAAARGLVEANKDSKGEPLRTKRKKGHVKAVNVRHVLTPDAGERLLRAIDILLGSAAVLPPSVNAKKEEVTQGEKSDDGTTKTN